MKAIGNFIVIDEINEPLTKTAGGLELTDKLKEDIRYRKGKIISSGPDLLKKDQVIDHDIQLESLHNRSIKTMNNRHSYSSQSRHTVYKTNGIRLNLMQSQKNV